MFDTTWLWDPIDVAIAQKYLGSSLAADVVASHLAVSPEDLIVPTDRMQGSFCSQKEAEALWRQMVDDFRAGARAGEPDLYHGKSVSPPRLRLKRVRFTIPVFDRAFNSAALTVSATGQMIWRTDAERARRSPRMFDEAGFLRHPAIEGAGHTYVYRKRNRRWIRVHATVDWVAD